MAVSIRLGNAHNESDCDDLARLRFAWRVTERDLDGMAYEEFRARLGEWWRRHASSHRAFIAADGVDRADAGTAVGTDAGAAIGTAVGMAWLALIERVPGPDRFTRWGGSVQSVYVSAACRDRGIGRLLVDRVIAEARSAGLDWLILHPSERSVWLYRRAGFAPSDQLLQLRPGADSCRAGPAL